MNRNNRKVRQTILNGLSPKFIITIFGLRDNYDRLRDNGRLGISIEAIFLM